MTTLAEITVPNSPTDWSERANTCVDSWDAARWSQRGQSERFIAVLDRVGPRPGETLLDYGCGTGALSELIDARVSYVGYDTAPGMLDRARQEHPGHRFTGCEPRWADVTVAIGVMNLPHRWSKEMTWATLRRLWDQTGRVLGVSLYAGEDSRCLIYTEDEVRAFARGESYRHLVERHRPNDLLMVLSR